ncbi:MAG TPA: aminotransferase, partial [Clostridiales bacterium]|nr:aminotransferase [Clostridiales bacterium]
KRKAVVERYRERLQGTKGITLGKENPDATPNYAYFPVVFDGYRYTRDEVFERLKGQGITARKYFYPLTNSFACYAGRPGFDSDLTPVAKHVAER